MKVPFADLVSMHKDLQAGFDEAIEEVFNAGSFILGPAVEQFEESFAKASGREHCVGVNSGTSALHLALLAAGVGPGDEVITTPHTWISTSWAVSYCGATPVFADVDPKTGNLDPAATAAAITQKTKALLPVDLYGNPADLVVFESLAEQNGIALVDDACQAHGSRLGDRLVGSFGTSACFSFYPGKNLGAAGEGGAIVTDDADMAARMRRLRNHAQAGAHEHVEIGYNYRMEGLQGAVLGVKLPYLDGWNNQRRQAAAVYNQMLESIEGAMAPIITPGADPNWHLYVVRVANRESVATRMQENGIDVRFHYPTPVHLQPAYSFLGHTRGSFPEAERYAGECLSLPMYPGITPAQQERVIEELALAVEVST